MKLIATVLAAFLAAAAVAEAKETRLLGSKASNKAGKGGSYSYSVSTKAGKDSKGGKGSKGSYSYSMSYPPICTELNEEYRPLYIVDGILGYQTQDMFGGDVSSTGPEECERWDLCNRGWVVATPQSLEQSLARCWEENASPSSEEQLTRTNPAYVEVGPQDNCGDNPCQ